MFFKGNNKKKISICNLFLLILKYAQINFIFYLQLKFVELFLKIN